MAIPEAALLKIGSWVAVAVAKRWVKDQTGSEPSTDALVRLVNENWASEVERRRAKRQFDRIAEEVVDTLSPFLETEFSAREPNDIAAAVVVAGDLLEAASLRLEDFLAADLDGDRIVEGLSPAVDAAGDDALLSPSGKQVLTVVVAETVNYLVEISSTLPEFQSQAARELLRRESYIVELVSRVLDEIPKHSMAEWATGEDRDFETSYRREVHRRMDRLELFGVRVSELSKRYALSVAYISLDLVTRSPNSNDVDVDSDDDFELSESQPAEDAVAASPRLLIRGEAGSGKTTLLRWLAVQAARRSFEEDLAAFNELVPIYLPLRQFVGKELPVPENFLLPGAPNVSGKMPPGWVHRQLERGSAVILIDGLDELPEEDRRRSREWLRELIAGFPECRYVITTRPPAVSNNWLLGEGFQESDLQPMDLPAIDAFVSHWFAAAREGTTAEEEAEELDRFEARLRAVIRENSSLRGLATSPLLCAMICALHRDRKTNLPTHRMELYRIALEMLLDRRDVERNVPGELETDISLPDKLGILANLAYWMILNDISDATTDDFKNRLDSARPRFQRIEASTDEIFDHLLLRSGLLRQPIEGRVDFIHRTFQEYLGARQVVEENSINLLINNGHLAQWREVVILAAGHCLDHQRTVLLRGLLDRADDEPFHRHALELLAISCLETSGTLESELRDELKRRLAALVPPKNMGDAKALASAGEIAVPMLQNHKHERVTSVAATVRALAMIGGEAALEALAEYGSDSRRGVLKEILRSWSTFDADAFAEKVLASSPLDAGSLEITGTEQIPYLHRLPNLKSLSLSLSNATDDQLRPLALIDSCQYVSLWRAQRVTTLSMLEPSRGLMLLAVRQGSVSDLSTLRGMDGLETLVLQNCAEVKDLTPVGDLEALEDLSLGGLGVTELRPLAGHPQLRRVSLLKMPLRDLQVLRSIPNLTALDVGAVSDDFSWIPDCPSLTRLRITAPGLQPSGLQSLTLHQLSIVGDVRTDFNFLQNLPNLSELVIEESSELAGLEAIPAAKLSVLHIPFVEGTDYSPLQELVGCEVSTSLSVLHALPDYSTFVDQNDVAVFYDLDMVRREDDVVMEDVRVGRVQLAFARHLPPGFPGQHYYRRVTMPPSFSVGHIVRHSVPQPD